jgi:AraC-like DNA-binding protein
MSEVNDNKNVTNTSTKEAINQINFERSIENILTYTKLINDIAMKVGFDEVDAFDFANQYYRWSCGFDRNDNEKI